MIMRNTFLILFFSLLLLSQAVFAQDKSKTVNETGAKLVDLYQWVGSDDASARIDNLVNEVQNSPKSKSILFVYCGKSCKYGEVEAHIRGIKLKLGYRKVDENQFIVLPGGFREKTETEFWLIPENDCPPIPKSTIKIEEIEFKGTFKRKIVPYECC
jgi:hypothetical protein